MIYFTQKYPFHAVCYSQTYLNMWIALNFYFNHCKSLASLFHNAYFWKMSLYKFIFICAKHPTHALDLQNTLLQKYILVMDFCILLCHGNFLSKKNQYIKIDHSTQIYPYPVFNLQSTHLSRNLHYYVLSLCREVASRPTHLNI